MSNSLISGNGKYVLVLQDDGNLVERRRNPITGVIDWTDTGALWANGIDEIDESAPKPPPVPPGPPTPISPLFISGQRFMRADNAQPFIYRGVTGFKLVEHLARGNAQQAIEYLTWARATGFNVVRVLAQCDNDFMSLDRPDGLAALPEALDLAASYGLYLEVVAIGSPFDDAAYPTWARTIAEVCFGHANALYELVNEPKNNLGGPWREMAFVDETARAATSGLDRLVWSAGAGPDDEALEPGGRYRTRHLNRERDLLNQVRRVRDLAEVMWTGAAPVVNDEPIGADERDGGTGGSLQRVAQPWFFYAMGALQSCFGVGGTFHHENGLRAELPGPVAQACAQAWMEGTSIVVDPDQGHLQYHNVGRTGSPVASAHFEDPQGGPIVRFYSFVAGQVAVGIVLHRPDDLPNIEDAARFNGTWHPVQDNSQFPHVRCLLLRQ